MWRGVEKIGKYLYLTVDEVQLLSSVASMHPTIINIFCGFFFSREFWVQFPIFLPMVWGISTSNPLDGAIAPAHGGDSALGLCLSC